MDRLLIVPAAGRGSRLQADGPKALATVAGRPMLDHVLDIHLGTVDRVVVVAAPEAVRDFVAFAAGRGAPVDVAVQHAATGMLDAILAAEPFVSALRPARVAITWCDQIALGQSTVERVRERARAHDAAALVFSTIQVDHPYIHFDRGPDGRIVRVRQRREGDSMPARGETDMGLFDLSLDAYLGDLHLFAREVKTAAGTGERNFLPFIPWLATRRPVETVPGVSPVEAVGINTPEELAAIEAHLSRKISHD